MSNASRRSPRRHPDEHELVQAVAASAALRQLLAAASAPPSTAELKGRARAIADFRAAQRPGRRDILPVTPASEADPERRPPVRLARVGRWSAARLTVACAAMVVLLGGTAAAAAAGELPNVLQNAVSELLNTPAPAGDSPPPAPGRTFTEPAVQPEPQRTGAGPSSAPKRSGSSTAAAPTGAASADSPQLAGLCRAYQAAGSVEAAALLARPGFALLVTAADGPPRVTAFCARLTGPVSTVAPGPRPSSTDRPAARRESAVGSSAERPSGVQPAAAARPTPASQSRLGRAHSGSQPQAERAVTSVATEPPATAEHAASSGSGAPVERPNSRQ